MASFNVGFTRPGTYVQQTSGQGAPALPPSFVAIMLGCGAASYVTTKDIVMGTGTDVVDATHAASSVTSVTNKSTGVIYTASGSNGYTLSNTGTIFSLVWAGVAGTDKPVQGATYTVAYLATKNAVSDYLPLSYTSLQAQINYSGIPAASVSAVMSGVYETNNVSLAAAIGVAQGMGQWYSLELDPWDETSGPTAGTIISGESPSTSLTAGGTVNFNININGDGAQLISPATNATGALIAADIQTKVRALTAVTPANQAAINGFECNYDDDVAGKYVLISGSTGVASTLVVTEGTGTTAADLKITAATDTSNIDGELYTALDLTVESEMKTAVTQALLKLMLIEGYALVPCFPMVSSGVNNSIISVINAHIVSARSLIEQKWRVALYGLQKGTDTGATPETKYITLAGVLAAGQVAKASVVVAPATSVYSYGTTQFTLDGYGVAAAIAGIVANPTYTPGEPISGKQLVGFDSVTDPFNNTQKALMGNAGVLMIDSELGTPAVIMDLTTDQTTAVNSQLKFTKAADYVSKSLRLILRRIYINTRNLGPSTLSAIAATVRMVLQQMVWLGIINDFIGLSVTRNSLDARQVDVSVQVLLTPDISWIYIQLGVGI